MQVQGKKDKIEKRTKEAEETDREREKKIKIQTPKKERIKNCTV